MNLREKLKGIRSNISSAQEKAGINHSVEIVGVTKTHPFSFIEASYEAGIRSIGENRIQEASTKFESFEQMPELKKGLLGTCNLIKQKSVLSCLIQLTQLAQLKLCGKLENMLDN